MKNQNWNWDPADAGRVKRAQSVKFTVLDLNQEQPYGYAAGSGMEDYHVTLDSCTCADFSIMQRKGAPSPCKHILALAIKAGIINENGLTAEQQRKADIDSLKSQLAFAYGYYYLFDDPMISDKEYDRLKARYLSITENTVSQE